MDMIGERRIPAPRDIVWAALNNPAVLKAAIPGCNGLEMTSDTTMAATATVKIGPVTARFAGKVTLSDIDPPSGYTITGEGQGGVAGFAHGGAKVRLAEVDANSTILAYDVRAQVGGKLAQLGTRMVDATAKQMADTFFDRFTAEVTRRATSTSASTVEAPPSAADEVVTIPLLSGPIGGIVKNGAWFGGGALSMLVIMFIIRQLRGK
jgi:uncharacterized protein